jgi:hypothetical protein
LGATATALATAARQEGAARRHLRALDACLQAVEDANERGETVVSPALAARLRARVPAIRPGMPTADALDCVFDRQQAAMRPGAGPRCISEGEARALTERIRDGVEEVGLLLLEARRRRAWVALGYPTWERYVRAELGLSRTRSYELLYHGEVVRALRAAAGGFGIPNISPYAALQIKGHLGEVQETIRRRLRGVTSEAEAALAVRAAVEEVRRRVARPPARGAGDPDRRLRDAIACLARLPPPAELARRVDDEEALRLAGQAARWLTEFARAVSERRTVAQGEE